MKKFNVVFCGTPDFSVPSLDMLNNHPEINLLGVITMPDRPAGRGHQLQSPAVAVYAKENKIPLFQTENLNRSDEIINFLNDNKIDFIVVLAFAQFLGSKVLNAPKLGCFNIHTSLLPKYRGAAPIQYALLNGDKSTGVSIQKMVKQMDAGDLVKEFPIAISETETGGQLYTRLKYAAALTLNDFISDLKNNNVSYKAQDESGVSFAPTLKKEDGIIDWQNKTAFQIHNQVRALKPWPGTSATVNGKRTKIIDLKISNELSLKPSEAKVFNNKLFVGTLDGTLEILTLQQEGKKVCSALDFLNGLQGNFNISLK